MNTSAPRLSPFFRSDAQAEILARVLLNPGSSFTTAELARFSGSPYASAHREVRRLVDAGLVRQQKVGRAIHVSANTEDPAFSPAAELLRLSYGPAVVIPRALAGIAGVEEAYVYGSWAARRLGESGSAPVDVDVLVVGNPSRAAIHDAADEAGQQLGREVNIRIVPLATWDSGDDPFLSTVKARPTVRLNIPREERR